MSPGLERLLDDAAHRIAARGTLPEERLLHEIAVAARATCPGAAAALVDWEGSEVARQRAFGVVHGALLTGLDPLAQAVLAVRLTGAPASPPAR